MTAKKAIVLFSGGQDSTTCLAWALSRFGRVETVGFDYGQRNGAELAARQRILSRMRSEFSDWAKRLGSDHLLSLEVLKQIGGNALTDNVKIAMSESGLPNTFVPGRNIFFLTAAAALAYRRECRDLVGGMCEADYSGYPDCRADTMEAVTHALNLGMDTHFTIHTPLMKLDKAATWAFAEQLGGKALIDLIVEETVSCYEGDREHRHAWGYGCGKCPACNLRARGYERYVLP